MLPIFNLIFIYEPKIKIGLLLTLLYASLFKIEIQLCNSNSINGNIEIETVKDMSTFQI